MEKEKFLNTVAEPDTILLRHDNNRSHFSPVSVVKISLFPTLVLLIVVQRIKSNYSRCAT